MNSKLSYRKKLIIQKGTPALLIILMGIIVILKLDYRLTGIIMVIAMITFAGMAINIKQHNCEPEDEMAKYNQYKAGDLSFTITLASVGIGMIYVVYNKTSITFSIPAFMFLFAGISILNLIIFLVYDIRGI
jgi:Ca2+/Na+ antiporter